MNKEYIKPKFLNGWDFNACVQKKVWYRTIHKEGDCIVCETKPNQDGYIRTNGYHFGEKRLVMLHKALWEKEHGKVPEGMELNHKCLNRKCFNPEHLELIDGSKHATLTNVNRVGYKMVRFEFEKIAEMYYQIKAKILSINNVVKKYGIKRSTMSSIVNKRSRCEVTSVVDDYILMESSLTLDNNTQNMR